MDGNEAANLAWDMRVSLTRVALSILHHNADAEDAVSSAMVQAYRSAETLRDASRFAPWMMRILVRGCYDILRRRKREVLTDDMSTYDLPILTGMDSSILGYIQALPPAYQRVLVLHYYEGFKTSEIAHILSLPLGTVLVQLSRGRKKLKQIMLSEEATQHDEQAI